MVAILQLISGTGPSSWRTYLWVGAGVAIAGAILLVAAGGLTSPAQGIARASYYLSIFLVVLGVATAVAGLGLRRRAKSSSQVA